MQSLSSHAGPCVSRPSHRARNQRDHPCGFHTKIPNARQAAGRERRRAAGPAQRVAHLGLPSPVDTIMSMAYTSPSSNSKSSVRASGEARCSTAFCASMTKRVIW